MLVENQPADPSAANIQVSTATSLPEAAIMTDTPTLAAAACPDCTPTPTPRPTDTPTPAETATATPTAQPSDTPAPTETTRPTATFTATPIVIAQKNPVPAAIPTQALPASVASGLPTGRIVFGVALEVAVVVGIIALYRSRKKK